MNPQTYAPRGRGRGVDIVVLVMVPVVAGVDTSKVLAVPSTDFIPTPTGQARRESRPFGELLQSGWTLAAATASNSGWDNASIFTFIER